MTLPGETIYSGAPETCEDCGVELVPKVCQSGAGLYIGTWCNCGPYSRESGYFATREEAEAILEAHPSEYARSTDFEAGPEEDVLARTKRLLEVLADALAAPGMAQLGEAGDDA
jgi:hypothetical protein